MARLALSVCRKVFFDSYRSLRRRMSREFQADLFTSELFIVGPKCAVIFTAVDCFVSRFHGVLAMTMCG